MQTFLAFPDYAESARVLDSIRLRNQRRESKSILTSIESMSGWFNHPATRMWWGYERHLCLYTLAIMDECKRRGTKSETRSWFIDRLSRYPDRVPHYIGDEAFHKSHRSNLIRKQPEIYRDVLGWTEQDDLPYIWPGSYYAYNCILQ